MKKWYGHMKKQTHSFEIDSFINQYISNANVTLY